MAAYASLLSLGHLLDQLLQHPPRQRAVLEKAHIDSLLENITFLQEFLEDFSLIRWDEIQALEEKIARSAYAAEDIIEKRVVDQILDDSEAGSEGRSTFFFQDLQKVIEEIDSMKEDVLKIKETEGIKIMEQPRYAATAGSLVRGASDSKNTMVGFDKDLNQIMDTLTANASNLQILSVVGMGGMGKTTLARNVFDNPSIEHHFDLHAWVSISQQYSVHEILLGLLKGIGVEITHENDDKLGLRLAGRGEEITHENDDELGLRLHRSLFDRRYFIVMDDMWSIEAWDGIKRLFPDNSNGSRVLVTTRLSKVADNFQSCSPHRLHFLDEDNSWALFCDKVFGKESCPPELEEVGKTIVKNCRGLPLAIVAISGLLEKSSRMVEYWEYIANDTYAALNMGGDGLCFEILSLSYKHLPVHLKPCFLYMGIFPEDHVIRISRLVKLWVAERILKPIKYRSLEEIAEDNLKDLVDRNLIQVHDYGSSNKIKTCTIHDLLRDLCLREAEKEKFLCGTKFHSRIIRDMHRGRMFEQVFDTRLFACSESKCTSAKLHRLLIALNIDDICSYEKIVQLVKSRYFDFKYFCPPLSNPFESLSLLWNLQSITIDHTPGVQPINLPAEIWEMPQLRHLKCEDGDFYLPEPLSTNSNNGRRDTFVLKNLHTLSKIRSFRCTDEVVHRIPNLKKLGITYRQRFGWDYHEGYNLTYRTREFGWDHYEVYNLAHLRNLESLFLHSDDKDVLQNLCFPQSLKKLTLVNCGVCWEDLTVVGSLPHLEVLNLRYNAVRGREWNPVEGQFLELKCLRIDNTDVEEWIADNSHFPRLEKLRLGFLRRLKEIPYGIGEIQTLRSISLKYCNSSADSSAKKIQEEQQRLGNYDLQVHVVSRPLLWGAQIF